MYRFKCKRELISSNIKTYIYIYIQRKIVVYNKNMQIQNIWLYIHSYRDSSTVSPCLEPTISEQLMSTNGCIFRPPANAPWRAPCRWWRPAGFCSNNSLFYQQTCMISVHTHIETELYIQYSSIIYHYLSFFWYAYRNLELTYPCSKNQEGMWTVTRIALKCIKMPHLTAGVFCSRWLFNLPFRKICILALHSELEIHSHLQESMALRQTGRNLPAYTNMGTFTTSYGGFLHGTYRFTNSVSELNVKNVHELDVSENSGTPKSSILIGLSIIMHPFWGTPIFGNTQLRISNPRNEKKHCLKNRWKFVTWTQVFDPILCWTTRKGPWEMTKGTWSKSSSKARKAYQITCRNPWHLPPKKNMVKYLC